MDELYVLLLLFVVFEYDILLRIQNLTLWLSEGS